jgi:hypothetical protein
MQRVMTLMDLIRQFLHQIVQFHSIEEGYLRRHANLFGIHYQMIHNERSLMWNIQSIYPTELHDINAWIPALEFPADYNERDSLEQLRGFYMLARAAVNEMQAHPLLSAFAKVLYTRYDSAAWFLDGWLQHHQLQKLTNGCQS